MRDAFTIEYKGKNFQFEVDRNDGLVWLIQNDKVESKTNNGQITPARNLEEAKNIAELMLYTMGY